MASKKITDMPNWGGNQVPTDLLTGVDLSATVANQNVKSTLNDLFSVITKNITDGAVRWQGVAAPAVSAAGAGSIYFSTADNIYYASENGAAYVPLITKPAGSNKQVQFNNAAAFGGAAGFEYQAAASPNVQITAQNAAYTALQIDSAATPSAPIVKIRNTTADLYDFNVSDLTITKTTAFSIWLKTNAGAASSFRVGANSGTHPGTAYGLLFPYVGGSNSDGPGIYWTDGTYGSTVRLNLNLGLNFQGSSGVNAFRIRKATDNLNDGDLIFDFRPNDANFSLHPWGTNPGETTPIIFRELLANGTNYVGFKAPDAIPIAGDCVWTLPSADGTSGQALTTNGSKVLSWTTISGGSVAGSNKQVQFNNSAAFGGAAGFEYQAAASPNVSITAQNAAYVPLFVNTASTPSASIQQWAINNTVAVEIDKDGYLYLGQGIVSATPQTGKIFATGGTGNNVAGGSLILYGGTGTGTGQGGSIAFYTSPAGLGGNTPNTPVVYGELDQLGNWFLGDTNALLGTSATNGFFYCQATNGIPAGTPAATWTGIMPITIDATNYRLYSYIGGAWRNLTGGAGGITIGTTAITSGTAGRILYETSGNVVGEIAGSSADANGAVQWAATARTSGVAQYFRINTPADTGQTASTESVGIYFGGNGSGSTVTRTWAAGNITTQRENVFVAPTYAFASGSNTIASAATVFITGPPVAGANAIITNSHALRLQATVANGAIGIYDGTTLRGEIGTQYGYMYLGQADGIRQTIVAGGYNSIYLGTSGIAINSNATPNNWIELWGINNSKPALFVTQVSTQATATYPLASYRMYTTATNASSLHSYFTMNTNGTAAAGLGGQMVYRLETTTTEDVTAAAMDWLWTDATHATRTAALSFSTVQNAASLTERARITFDGTRSHFIIGNGGNVASPVGGLIQATSGADGSTNVNGADLILAGGQPTGNGTAGQVLRKYSLQGASGTTLRALSSSNYNIPAVMFTATASATVSNTTSETTIIGSGIGTTTMEAGMWRPGRTLRIRVSGYLTTTGTPTLQIRWKLGSTTIADTTAQTLSASISGNEYFEAFIDLSCRTIGATGTVIGQGAFRYHVGGGSAALDFLEALNTAAVTIDTTTALAVDVTAQWGTASASNTIVGTNTTIEILN